MTESHTGADGLIYTVDKSPYPNTLTISGSGPMTALVEGDLKDNLGDTYHFATVKNCTVENGVTSVGARAFENTDLETIYLGDDVETIGSYESFGFHLVSITVSQNNPYFSSEGGVLFNKSKTSLIRYPCYKPDTSYIMPNTVTVINPYAFYYSGRYLTSITMSDSLEIISDYAFYSFGYAAATKAWDLIIPDSVTHIGDHAFERGVDSCRSITIGKNVTYIGKSAFIRCYLLEELIYDVAAILSFDLNDYVFFDLGIHLPSGKYTKITFGPDVVAVPSYFLVRPPGEGTNKINWVTITEGISSIGKRAFYGNSSLTDMTFLAQIPPILDDSRSIPSDVTIHVSNVTLPMYENTSSYDQYNLVSFRYVITYVFFNNDTYITTSSTDTHDLYSDKDHLRNVSVWQPYQSSGTIVIGNAASESSTVKLNTISNIFYAVEAPERDDDVARVVICAGSYPALDFGDIQSVTDTYTSQLTTIPILPKGYSGSFTMDTGVQRQITVKYKRVAPLDPDDTSTDSRDWTNAKWKQVLDQYTDRWQMETNGCRLHIVAPDDATMEKEYTFTDYYDEDEDEWVEDEMGINAYISSAPVEYSNSTMYAIEESITFKVGTIYPHPREEKMADIAIYSYVDGRISRVQKEGANLFIKCPVEGISLLPSLVLPDTDLSSTTGYLYPLCWYAMKYEGGVASIRGDPIGGVREPYQLSDTVYTGNTGYALAGYFVTQKGELLSTGDILTNIKLENNQLYYFYICGGGGAGGAGAQAVADVATFLGVNQYFGVVYAGGGGGGAGKMTYSTYTTPATGDIRLDVSIGVGGQTASANGNQSSFRVTQNGRPVHTSSGAGGNGGASATSSKSGISAAYAYGGAEGSAGGSSEGAGGQGGSAQTVHRTGESWRTGWDGTCTDGSDGSDSVSARDLYGSGGKATSESNGGRPCVERYYAGGGGGGAPQIPQCPDRYVGRGKNQGFYGGNGATRTSNATVGKWGGGGGGGLGSNSAEIVRAPAKGGDGYLYYVRVVTQ